MASLPRDTWIRLIAWLALAPVVYRAFGSAFLVAPESDGRGLDPTLVTAWDPVQLAP
jgi:hypothetical protein